MIRDLSHVYPFKGLPGGAVVRKLPAVRETWVRSQGWEDPLKKQMATHSSTLAWEIPWMGNRQATVHGTTELDATEHPLNKPAVGFIDFFFNFKKQSGRLIHKVS